jgi:hypothetical protein
MHWRLKLLQELMACSGVISGVGKGIIGMTSIHQGCTPGLT